MELRKTLNFEKAAIESSHDYPTEKGLKTVLVFSAKLTADLAARLDCSDLYTTNGVPREWFDKVDLPLNVTDARLVLPAAVGEGLDEVRPETIYKWKAAKGEDGAIVVKFRAHLLDSAFDTREFLMANQGREFALSIRPTQAELFDGEPNSIAAEARGGDVTPVAALASKREAEQGGYSKRPKPPRNGVLSALNQASQTETAPQA